jgi:hypothetical protein
MSESIKGVAWLINFALSLGTVSGLADLTVNMSHEAWRADHRGIVSIHSSHMRGIPSSRSFASSRS